jgi:molecular chaperone GrpE (heat shock protein)
MFELIDLIFDKLGRANIWEILFILLIIIVLVVAFSVVILSLFKIIINLSKYDIKFDKKPNQKYKKRLGLVDYFVERHNNKDYVKLLYNVHTSLLNAAVEQEQNLLDRIDESNSKYIKSTSGVKSALMSISDQIQKSNIQNKELLNILSSLQNQYEALSKIVDEKNKEIQQLKSGYNNTVLKLFINKIILLIHDLQYANTSSDNELIIQAIENVLLQAHIQRIDINIGDDFNPKIAKAFGTEITLQQELIGKISKVSTYGYEIMQGDVFNVISPAAVYVYKYEGEQKLDEEYSRN